MRRIRSIRRSSKKGEMIAFVAVMVFILIFPTACYKSINNHRPSTPEVALSPAIPTTSDDLVCTITAPSIDSDGDDLTYSYEWYKDGDLQLGVSDSIVDAEDTIAGETWRCVVTASDGWAASRKVTAQATIRLTGPSNLVVLVVSSALVELTWDPATDTDVTAYKVYRDNIEVASITDTYYSDTAVSPGITYTYWITTQDVAGTESAPSGSVQATTSEENPQNSPPTMPVVDVIPDNPLTTD
ncbi:MAG: hypothetical protein SVY53_10345, partial [Chloroflexota bacterium]|nr:hypothetical protein [Chloroflexota bacterium]